MDAEKIAGDVAERVRELMADAERRAAEIISAAEADAQRIRESAERDAARRLEEVRAGLDDLQGKLGGSRAEVTPGPVTVPEPSPPDIPEPTPDPVPEPVPTPEPVPEPVPDPAPEPVPPADDTGGAEGANGDAGSDKSAARLVAMKMALDGSPREEIEAHLEANYEVEHRDKLLDDVLARAKA
jgi:outer membrane biosynthesis protein TonB